MTHQLLLRHHVTLTWACVLAGDSLTQISLTGRDVQDQHHLLIQAPITIILVGQVRYTFV